jgi:hypothetical protein
MSVHNEQHGTMNHARSHNRCPRFLPAAAALALWALTLAGSMGPALASDPLPGLMPKGELPDALKKVTARTKVGSWVEYSVWQKRVKQRYRWKMALVGKEGKNKYWWEYQIQWGRLRSLVIKILLRGPMHDPKKLVRAIWKPGGHQAVEIPVRKGKKLVDLYALRPRGKGKLVGKRALQVAAGRFATMYFVSKNRRGQMVHFWTSKSVPIMGLVKLASPSIRLELIGYGSRARSMIRGKPGRWPGL